jgi:hypothetical protein
METGLEFKDSLSSGNALKKENQRVDSVAKPIQEEQLFEILQRDETWARGSHDTDLGLICRPSYLVDCVVN